MAAKGIEIIYQDSALLVVNKPAGLSVTSGRSGDTELRASLQKQLKIKPNLLRRVHRLDKDTSGVMLLAKNEETHRLLSSEFETRNVNKTYLAFVRGAVNTNEGTIDAPLAPNPKNPALMRISPKNGKEALTAWRLLADFGGLALLAVYPLTGRTHQIRVHLSSIGLPLAVDPLYAASQGIFLSEFKAEYRLGRGQTEKPLIDRLTLHAYQIDFAKPLPNMPPYFVAPLDRKFAAAIKMLTRHSTRGMAAFVNQDCFSKILAAQPLPYPSSL